MNLDRGISNSLQAKLNAALESIESGRDGAAERQLGAFINEVNAQSGKKINPSQAEQLISTAEDIMSTIG